MAGWSEIPFDLAKKIAEKIEYHEDFESFGQVCSWWRNVMKVADRSKATRQAPWLMLAEPPSTSRRRFYSLYNRKVRHVKLPEPIQGDDDEYGNGNALRRLFSEEEEEGDWRYLSSQGWLICITQVGMLMSLVHPLSMQVITLPTLPASILHTDFLDWYCWETEKLYMHLFFKFALSKSPSVTSDYHLAMLFLPCCKLALWRAGDDLWTFADTDEYIHIADICFCKGMLYALDRKFKVLAIALDQVDEEESKGNCASVRVVADLQHTCYYPYMGYLVESKGRLLAIFRKAKENKSCIGPIYGTTRFQVWQVDVATGVATKVTSLENMSVFIGFNSSFSVDCSPPHCCRPNCIYYTDDLEELHVCNPFGGGLDMGVYDVTCGRKVEDFYHGPSRLSYSTPPLWVEPPTLTTM